MINARLIYDVSVRLMVNDLYFYNQSKECIEDIHKPVQIISERGLSSMCFTHEDLWKQTQLSDLMFNMEVIIFMFRLFQHQKAISVWWLYFPCGLRLLTLCVGLFLTLNLTFDHTQGHVRSGLMCIKLHRLTRQKILITGQTFL